MIEKLEMVVVVEEGEEAERASAVRGGGGVYKAHAQTVCPQMLSGFMRRVSVADLYDDQGFR